MKKLLVLLLMIAMVFTFAACGGGEKEPAGTEGGQTSQGEDVPDVEEPSDTPDVSSTAPDMTTLEGWLAYWGLTEDDLKPANFTRLDITSYSLETGEIKEVGAYVDKKLTDEEAATWIEKVIAKLNSLSEEGKLANIAKDGEPLTTDFLMELSMKIGSGQFTYNGKDASAVIAVMPGSLDNSDPDEAMPACTLGLDH